MDHFLLQLFIFLAASAIAVPVAKKLGLGSVLGYLIAGIVIGPYGISLIDQVEDVMHLTEFGVVLMLFLVGLELKPSLLWQMRTPILGMGGMQVSLSALVIGGATLLFRKRSITHVIDEAVEPGRARGIRQRNWQNAREVARRNRRLSERRGVCGTG